MKYFKYTVIALVLIFSYGSKGYETGQKTPPYYKLVVAGLNNRLSNKVSDFPYSAYINKEIEHFRHTWGLKGVSIAIVKNDRLVYAHGFGIADDSQVTVAPGNIFRVASVSKLITAVAIMKLVEDDKLSLDECVFGPDGIIKDTILNHVRDKRIYKITVRDLLAHAGGWTLRLGDPAFNSLRIAEIVGDVPPATITTYYKYIAATHLSFNPGTRSVYSNMGYMFLSEVIHTVAGEPYESYIEKNILVPNGIVDMHIGNTYRKNKFSNEVQYYEQEDNQKVPEYNGSGTMVERSNGGNPIDLLSAAGGWVCSSIEMARLVALIDGESGVKDILSRRSIREMTNHTYAKGPLGWKNTSDNGDWYRTGSMAGTSAMIKRQRDGITWVFLSNTSSWKGYKLSADINRIMTKITNNVKNWTDTDLFKYYPIDSLSVANKL